MRLAAEDDQAAYLATALQAWLAEPLPDENHLGDEARLALSQQLMHHAFLQDILTLMEDTPWQAEELLERKHR